MGSINSRPRRTETGKQLRVSVIIPTLVSFVVSCNLYAHALTLCAPFQNEELHVADAIARHVLAFLLNGCLQLPTYKGEVCAARLIMERATPHDPKFLWSMEVVKIIQHPWPGKWA